MRYDEDIDIEPSFREQSEEDLDERNRRIQREVVRVPITHNEDDLIEGDFDDEDLRDGQEEAVRDEHADEERRRNSLMNRLFQTFFTGEILTNKSISHIYPYMLFVALMFVISISILFFALKLDIKRSRLQDELRVLQEQAVRQSEQLYKATSRSAIIEQSKARGLNLEELPTQTYIIDND